MHPVVLWVMLAQVGGEPPVVVVVDRDDVEIRESCRVRVDREPVLDADGDGVIHILGDGITVDFGGQRLHGAKQEQDPDVFSGTGVRIEARDVTMRNLHVSGFKVGVHAVEADGLLVEDCDVSGNFRQRLRSTPRAEDPLDWLRPHENDDNQWLHRYGAALAVEDSAEVTIRRIRARRGQNGIILDRVTESAIYDNDCSFLSGWGLAMWRSSGNLISRNAFDFCVRGYSHGRYNRGQDSAGILMFEQCSGNLIAENSVTHGGDGIFAFAGREALGEAAPREDLQWYEARGNNGNLIIVNDLSCAAAHGLELTFSFNNVVFGNRMSGNAICGLWGGYSQNTLVTGNLFQANGDMGYGLERGGINIEHGRGNRIEHNTFLENACGVHLWWDDDRTLLGLPWARANERGSRDNVLAFNRFRGDAVAVHLRGDVETVITAADVERVDEAIRADDASLYAWQEWDGPWPEPAVPRYHARGESRPRGARDELRGREHIIMTTWGPYDWRRPLVWLEKAAADHHVYRLLGDPPPEAVSLEATGDVRLVAGDEGGRVTVRTDASEALRPYTLRANGAAEPVRGVLAPLRWSVRFFPSKVDPREDEAAWHAGAADAVSVEVETLDLDFGTGGPDQLGLTPNAGLPSDHFGTMALTSVTVPPGRWRLRTVSDDGVRLWLDDELVIDDWTWHAPRENVHELNVTGSARTMRVRVEHFELDGHAVLEVAFEHVTAKTAPP